MKTDIHPQYFPKAGVKCACGNSFTVGSTKEFIETEICAQCHPFYTKKEKVLDTLGRVQKFKDRAAKKINRPKKVKKEKEEKEKVTI
jgi:large subunit ribosomal protein L31